MHVIRGSYHRDPARAGRYIHYISHREEVLPHGERREIYGIGERYLELFRTFPDPPERERAYRRLIGEDAERLRRPIFHQRVFTVDDRVAKNLASLPRAQAERGLREAFAKALRTTALGRQVQGVYAIHWHGGDGRPAHPHIHALLSPLRRDGRGTYLSKRDIGVLWSAWNREVDRTLLVRRFPIGYIPSPEQRGRSQMSAWVLGTAIAQANRLSSSRPFDYSQLGSAAQAVPYLLAGRSALAQAADFAHDPLRTLVRLAAMTTFRPLPRPLVMVARALHRLSHGRDREL